MEKLKELFGFFATDINCGLETRHAAISPEEQKLDRLLMKKLDQKTYDEATGFLVGIIADWQEKSFVDGFRYATQIWKEC